MDGGATETETSTVYHWGEPLTKTAERPSPGMRYRCTDNGLTSYLYGASLPGEHDDDYVPRLDNNPLPVEFYPSSSYQGINRRPNPDGVTITTTQAGVKIPSNRPVDSMVTENASTPRIGLHHGCEVEVVTIQEPTPDDKFGQAMVISGLLA